jgi:hypothetical protein
MRSWKDGEGSGGGGGQRWTLCSREIHTTKRHDAVFKALPLEVLCNRICVINPKPIGEFRREKASDFDVLVVKFAREEWPVSFLTSPDCFVNCEWSQEWPALFPVQQRGFSLREQILADGTSICHAVFFTKTKWSLSFRLEFQPVGNSGTTLLRTCIVRDSTA